MKKFLPVLNGKRVSPGQKLVTERMRRERRVHLHCVCVESASPLVTHRRPASKCRFGKVPRAVRPPNVNTRRKRLAVFGVHNFALDEHLLSLSFPLSHNRQRISRRLLRIDVVRQVTKRDRFEGVGVQIAHKLLETLRPRVHPGMLPIRHPVKLKHCDSAASCLYAP